MRETFCQAPIFSIVSSAARERRDIIQQPRYYIMRQTFCQAPIFLPRQCFCTCIAQAIFDTPGYIPST